MPHRTALVSALLWAIVAGMYIFNTLNDLPIVAWTDEHARIAFIVTLTTVATALLGGCLTMVLAAYRTPDRMHSLIAVVSDPWIGYGSACVLAVVVLQQAAGLQDVQIAQTVFMAGVAGIIATSIARLIAD